MNTVPCDRNRIDDFFQRNNSDADPELAQHLDTCEFCREYFDSQAAPPGEWLEAKQLLQPTEYDRASTAEFSAAAPGECTTRQPAMIKSVLASLAPTDDPHRLGRLGGYEISGVIGVGGMGVVLKAFDPTLDRVVAIKVMAPHLANSGTARKRFAREAKAAAAVLHPNVIPIYCVSSDDAIPYLVMAYIRGGSLQKRLDREGPLPTVEILRIGAQIAAGLAAAHEQGLVHRDIKPENILLDEGVERVTLTDFGLARAVDDASVTREGTIAGTPQYMSPEQSRGEQVDQQSDLFSLGSVLYALCTGRPPYRADSSYGVMRRIIDEAPVPIRELNPDIPDWLAAIVARLMAKDKAERFATAGEVHKLLEACLSHTQQPQIIPLPEIPGLGPQDTPRSFFSIPQARLGVFVMSVAASIAILAAAIISQVNRPSLTVTGPEPPAAEATSDSNKKPAAKPQLVIESQRNEDAYEIGEGGKYSWKLKGESVETMTIRVLHIENGKTRIVNESIYQGGTPGEQRIEVELKLKNSQEPMPTPGKMLTPSLAVSVNGLQAKAETGELFFFPGDFQKQSQSPRGPIAREEVLGWCAYNLKDGEVSGSLESLVAASKKGAAFLVTTVDWKGNDPAAAKKATDDIKEIQGTWQVTYAEDSGQVSLQEMLKDLKMVITPETMTIHLGGRKSESTYKLNPTTSPKSIDMTEQGRTKKGIYDLQGDTLRICFAEQSQERPTKFDSQPDSTNDVITVLKRVKDKADAKSNVYSLKDIKIIKTELNNDRLLEITYTSLVETMWYCPGANGERLEHGLELTFPRVLYNKKVDVDYPAIDKTGSIDKTIVVDPKDKPVFIKSGDNREKIWEPGGKKQKDGQAESQSSNLVNESQLALLELNVKQATSDAKYAEAEANRVNSLYSKKLVTQEELQAKLKESEDRILALEKARLLLQQHKAHLSIQKVSTKEQTITIDTAKLQGTWRGIYFEQSGKAEPPKKAKDHQLIIEKDTLSLISNDKEQKFSCKIDTQAVPVAIDLKNGVESEYGNGILDLRGDTLRLAMTWGQAKRPVSFDTTTDTKTTMLLIFKREVPHDAFNFADDIETEFYYRLEIDVGNFPDGELSAEAAREYTKEKRGVQLSSVTKLSRETAKVLAKTKDDLWLPELTDLPPEVLRELLLKKKGRLYLDGFTRLFPGIAKEIAKAQCPVSLSGLEWISEEDAAHLAKATHSLKLGLTEIDLPVAKQFAKHQGWLIFNKLKKLDESQAAALATHQGRLTLNGLITISPEVAESLGKFNSDALDLDSLAALDLETAKNLCAARCKQTLSLNGLKAITPELIAVLANGNYSLSLQGLVVRDIQTRRALDAAQVKLRATDKELIWGEVIEEETIRLGEEAPAGDIDKPVDVRALLEKGVADKSLPKGMVIRVSACMGAAADNKIKDLVEKWEFTPNEVHRIKTETKDGETIYTRLESKKCDTNTLCRKLLEGKAIEIDARQGTGESAVLLGTAYQIGSRSIDVEFQGQTILGLGETNGPFLHAYRETDAKAFGDLYEQLASQARVLFESQVKKNPR